MKNMLSTQFLHRVTRVRETMTNFTHRIGIILQLNALDAIVDYKVAACSDNDASIIFGIAIKFHARFVASNVLTGGFVVGERTVVCDATIV